MLKLPIGFYQDTTFTMILPNMQYSGITTQMLAMLLATSILLISCTSVTTIQSIPTGAKVYLNGETVGTTPYTHQDTKIVGSTTTLRLEKDGYKPFQAAFSRDEEVDVGAVIGGIFVFVPFLWTMKYKPLRTYELLESGVNQSNVSPRTLLQGKSKVEKLLALKQLFEEKSITQEEYSKEKKKIEEEQDK